MTTRIHLRSAIPLVLLGMLAGCVTEGENRKPKLNVPWPQDNMPSNMDALAEDLMAFQGMTGSLPLDLRQLDRAHVGTAGAPHASRGYAYHPAGIGVLRDGWCVMAVNDRILPREEGQAWAVLRPPVRIQGEPTLVVARVPMAELTQAAEMAKVKNGAATGK
jgi:hypothetical protein